MFKQYLPVLSLFLLSAVASWAQAPLTFDAASIKPSEPVTPAMVQAGKLHVGMKIDGHRVDIGNFTIQQLITKAYDVKSYQVQGLNWMTPTAQRFDVIATMPAGATKEQVPQMLQALLAERFKLVVHKEEKEQKVYALIVGKDGPKIKPTQEAAAPAAETNEDGSPKPQVSGSSTMNIKTSGAGGGAEVSTSEGLRQKMTPSTDGKSMHFDITRASMALLAEGLTPMVDRPIVDMTNLKGNYDVAFDISMADLMAVARAAGAAIPNSPNSASSSAPTDGASDPSGGSLFSAVQSLGLKLEARKAPLPMIVVDKAEQKPTEN